MGKVKAKREGKDEETYHPQNGQNGRRGARLSNNPRDRGNISTSGWDGVEILGTLGGMQPFPFVVKCMPKGVVACIDNLLQKCWRATCEQRGPPYYRRVQ